jgi:hypothetical protein
MNNRYSSSRYAPEKPRERRIHPIWRGVGFGMMVLIPIFAYAGADILLTENAKNNWFPIPADLISPYIEPLLYIRIMIIIALIFLGFVLFNFIAFIILGIFGPPRYGPTDVPSVHYGKTYKR